MAHWLQKYKVGNQETEQQKRVELKIFFYEFSLAIIQHLDKYDSGLDRTEQNRMLISVEDNIF